MELRDYQSKAIEDVRTAMALHRRVLLVSPTASGKTAMFSFIARGVCDKGRRVLILTHRKELVRQIGEALGKWGVPFRAILGGKNAVPSANVLIGNVFTVVKKVPQLQPPDLIICDEAHHLVSASTFGKIVAAFPTARLLGVTATPCRLDGKGLGEGFDTMVMGPTVAELTELEWLSPTEVYAPSAPNLANIKKRMGDYNATQLDGEMNKPSITGNAVQHYMRHCPGASAIAFCVSIAHAKAVADEFRSFGIAAESVDGKMNESLRDSVLNGLRDGSVRVVTSCDLISEGFDAPAVECAILLRPTKSLALYLQQVGRAIRISPGKTKTIILDHAGNSIEHGFVDEPREWTLSGGAPKKKKGAPPIRTCPQCYAAHHPAPECPMCGWEYLPGERGSQIEYREGQLIKVVDPKSLRRQDILGTDEKPKESQVKELEYLTNVARQRGYRNPPGWAYVVLRAREAKRLTKKLQKEGPRLNV